MELLACTPATTSLKHKNMRFPLIFLLGLFFTTAPVVNASLNSQPGTMEISNSTQPAANHENGTAVIIPQSRNNASTEVTGLDGTGKCTVGSEGVCPDVVEKGHGGVGMKVEGGEEEVKKTKAKKKGKKNARPQSTVVW